LKQGKQNLKLSALIVMVSIVVSRLTGFLREMLVPNIIGVNNVGDAYNLAFRITGLMYDLLVGGAIAAALIPILTGYLSKDEEEEGWKAIGTFINVIILSMTVVCLLGVLFAPQLIALVAQGYGNEEERRLTVELSRILFPSVAFLMLAGIANGVLNSYQRFAASAFGPSVYNLSSALSILIFGKSGMGVHAIAVGVMCSSFLYFIIQLLFARKNLKFYRPTLYLKNEGFLKCFFLAIPSMLSSAIVQVNVIITGSFATLFQAGSVTALNIADRTWQMPYGVFAQGMGIAMLPTLSQKFAKGEPEEFLKTLMSGLKTVLILTIPSGVGFIVLREPIVKTIFQFSDKFDNTHIPIAATVLAFFSIALLSQSMVTILNRAFYARNDTWTPLLVGASTIVFNILMSSFFYRTTELGVGGMALSYSMASLLNACLLISILHMKMDGVPFRDFFLFLVRVLPSALVMGLVLFGLDHYLTVFVSEDKVIQMAGLAFKIGIGVIAYFGMILILKVEEGIYVKEKFLKKLKRKKS
jgi:putative peptidoglycan lipid II flippase